MDADPSLQSQPRCDNGLMEYALQTIGGSYEEFLTAARWAEGKGLAAFAIPDHYLYGSADDALPNPADDAFAVMAGLARETTDIELVVLVSPVTFRHPSVLVKNAATIQEMAGGRFKMGVGTGWFEEEHDRFGIDFPDTKTRFAMAEETLRYLRAAFSEPPADFTGEFYRFQAFDMQPRPRLRLVVGGTGRVKTPRLAGEYADELNAYPASPDEYQAKIDRARHAAVAAGRDPGKLLISSSGQIVAGATEAEYHNLLEEIAARSGADPAQLERAAAKRNAPRGTWKQVRTIIDGMAATGLTRFYFQGPFDPAGIEDKLANLT